MQATQSNIWAITSYYNPISYKRRLSNFKIFKNKLTIPLLTVELSTSNNFELKSSDSEVLIQVQSNSVLWHKERLLNIALKHIPKHVDYIAWLDCDVIISNPFWTNEVIEKLSSYKLVQLFSNLTDMHQSEEIESNGSINQNITGYSVAYLSEENKLSAEDYNPSQTGSVRRCLFGLGWAAEKRIIETCGFYDAMVIGSGDRAMACAGYGRFEDAINVAKMSEVRKKHYLNWAYKFHELIEGKISYLDNKLVHLWHGDLSNRKYVERHSDFSKLDFNPFEDIILNDFDCWEWKNNKGIFQTFIKNYLTNRKEDGDLI